MKVRVLVSALSVSLFSLVSFAQPASDQTAQPSTMPSMQPSTAQPSTMMPAKPDGEALQNLIIVDSYEVAAAREALKNSTNPAVKKFAIAMIRDHGRNLAVVKATAHKLKITPTASDKSNELQKDGTDELAKLKTLKGKDFDQEYITVMVKGHGDVLALLDNTLIPNASNPKVAAVLKATRETVAKHLQMAQDVQKTLTS